MRIAMLSDDWWPITGGGPAHVKSLSIALAEYFDDDVDVYTRQLRDNGTAYTAEETYVDGQVRVVRLGPCTEFRNPIGRTTSTLTPLPKLLANDYDVIHGHTYLPAIPLRLSKVLTGAATVFTVHGMPLTSEAESESGITDRVREWAISQLVFGFDYDSVISVNRTNMSRLEENQDDVTYIPNGVDVNRFRPDAAPDEKKVLYLGRLDPQKRIDILIDAFSEIADEFPDRDLVIVGTGRQEEELKQRAAQSAAADRIHFTGRVSDEEVPRHYASAELFVLPSRWEGHPLSLLEAWASGSPVLASNVNGIREFVDHRKNGCLVDPNSTDSLAAGLRCALTHSDEVRQWGHEGRKRVHEEFTWKRCATRTRRVYRSAISETPDRGPAATTLK